MQYSSIPAKLPIPFADSGGKNTIQTASQIGVDAGRASLTDGFPPATRTPLAAGGKPPAGLDMNGILFMISAWARWTSAGGPVKYDSAFATATGGYPAGAMIASNTVGRVWVNLVDNNTTDPNAGGANWRDAIGGGGSLSANGWQMLPGGLIVQWGTATTTTGQQETIALPTTYPNQHFFAIAGEANVSGWEVGGLINPRVFGTGTRTLSNFRLTGAVLQNGQPTVFATGTAFSFISMGR